MEMTQKQKLKFGDFLIIAFSVIIFVATIILYGQKIFWNKKNQTIENSIQIKTKTIEELKLKNKIPKVSTIQEILEKANSKRMVFSPIIAGMWQLETQTVNFKSFSMNDNKINISAYSDSTETIAKFIELLKRTPRISNAFVTNLSPSTTGIDFNFIFDLLNQ
jgi:cell division protein FtsL